MADRTVHGRTRYGSEIVRYDKAGKWYQEFSPGQRIKLTLGEAVELVTYDGSEAYLDLAGGTRFAAAVRAWRA